MNLNDAKEMLWKFFEESKSTKAVSFRFFISILILISVFLALCQIFYSDILLPFTQIVEIVEKIILGIFTLEFFLRVFSSPSKKAFINDKYNIIDFFAIFPFYIGIQSTVILRIFRALRILRFVKLIKQGGILEVFQFKNTIVEIISPVVIMLVVFKLIFWHLEVKGIWNIEQDLSSLFTIIGFALGVVLSQKIGNTYKKYVEVERALFTLHGKLNSFTINVNYVSRGKVGIKIIHKWLKNFMEIFYGPNEEGVRKLGKLNKEIYDEVAKIGNTKLVPFHRLSQYIKEIFELSIYILSKKASYTPEAYDKLLQQITVLYLLLLAMFIPGLTGFIALILASYLLYGLYYITRDLDLVVGNGNKELIKLEMKKIENYLKSLDNEINN